MSLIEYTLEGKIDRIQIAIERLKSFEPPEGYYLAFSGGKDSITIYELARMSGVKFDAHFNFTTVDPPEVIKYTRENYPDVLIDRPEKTMWKLIEEKMIPPTRIIRYCCAYLKERGGEGRMVVTGIRSSESIKRRKRKMNESCYSTNKRLLNPIIDWSDYDVWEFIKKYNLKYCCLYNQGYKRIGCILCPMQTIRGKLRDKTRYPNFYKAYLLAFKKMIINRTKNNKDKSWKTPEEVMKWWIYGKGLKINQDSLFDMAKDIYN